MGTITAEVVDTGEKRDVRGRRVIPRSERLRLIETYQTSGISMAEFARREAINYTTFAGWVQRAGVAQTSDPIRFAEVKVATTQPSEMKSAVGLEVRLPDGTVVRGERVADVAALVQALRS